MAASNLNNAVSLPDLTLSGALAALAIQAIVQPALWRDWTDSLVKLFGCHGAQFWTLNRGDGEFSRVYFSVPGRNSDNLATEYLSGWDRLDPNRSEICRATVPTVFAGQTDSLSQQQNSRFMRWREAAVGARHHLTVCVPVSEKTSVGLTLFSAQERAFTDSHAHAQVSAMLPWLSSYFGLSYRHASSIDDMLWSGLSERDDDITILLDESGNVARMTSAAASVVASGCNLVVRNDRVGAHFPSDNDILQASIERAMDPVSPRTSSMVLRELAGFKPLLLTVSPVARRAGRILCDREPVVVLRAMSMDTRHVVTDANAKDAFRLTSREVQVAAFLKQGFSIDEAAEALRMSPETLRVHRRNLYRKVSVDRQARLVRALHLI